MARQPGRPDGLIAAALCEWTTPLWIVGKLHALGVYRGVDRLAMPSFIEVYNRSPCCIAGGHAVPAGNDNWPTT